MLKMLKDMRAAVLISLVTVILSGIAGSYASIAALRQEAADFYYAQPAAGQKSPFSLTNDILDLGKKMVKIAEKHSASVQKELNAAKRTQAAFEGATSGGDKLKVTPEYVHSLFALSDALSLRDLNEFDRRALHEQDSEITSLYAKIRNSGIKEEISKYSDAISGFPAGILSALYGLKVPLYD